MARQASDSTNVEITVSETKFVEAVSAEIMDRFQIEAVDGLQIPEWEAQALARGSWIRLSQK